jgi:hypothetical protein
VEHGELGQSRRQLQEGDGVMGEMGSDPSGR